MARLADSYTAAHEVVLVDPGVLRDVAVSLSGLWAPEHEENPERREQLVAAARLRLYGAAADRSGWAMVTIRDAHDKANQRDADWSAGFLPALESYDDVPPEKDIVALQEVLHRGEHLDREIGRTLALALLVAPVQMVITREPDTYHHQREGDLPERLEIVDPVEAAARLELRPGESAWIEPPAGSMLAEGDPWWEPPTS